ncbi:MAG: hypothetical protein ACTSUB_09815, partial [Candidatus Thorarchaeota archaeon]
MMKNPKILILGITILLLLSMDIDSGITTDTMIFNVRSETSSFETGKIVFDYSHGQYSSSVAADDAWLDGNLTEMGYEVVWAKGGINSSILADAQGFVAGAIYGEANNFSSEEIADITLWFNSGNKFMWIAYDGDYDGRYINDNMTAILSGVGSHVYGEPAFIEDPEENCGAAYRAVANTTSSDPFASEIVEGVSHVVMHGSTCLYGSTTADPNSGAVSLEDTSISEVYPLLYYSAAATIVDHNVPEPLVHTIDQIGAFTASTIELSTGDDSSGIIIVSGASPYGDYRPMYTDSYYGVTLTGNLFVLQAIDFGMLHAQGYDLQEPLVDHPSDISFEEGLTGNSIAWNTSDANPANYTILKDDVVYKSGPWNSSSESITILLDELLTGVYNYTIVLTDTYGSTSTDTVIVTVVENLAPTINHPSDVSYSEGDTDNSITWNPFDTHPDFYEIYRNGTMTHTANWFSGTDIELVVDGLSAGTWNHTIIVYDEAGNSAVDTVLVNV